MAWKDAFSESDWKEVARAPMIVSFAVTAADPSGLLGIARESTATAWALAAAREHEGTLAAEVVAEYETPEGRESANDCIKGLTKGRRPEEATGSAIDRLEEIARMVDDAVPEAAPAFKEWLRSIAVDVAEAAMEGGFLGFGGQRVSDAERKTLADIDTVLGL